jgi:hypothetical protein
MNVEFILYVLPLDQACIKALKYTAAISLPVLECDVKRMKKKPRWLDGVPLLLDRKDGFIYKGTNCLKKLQTMCVSNPVRTGKRSNRHIPSLNVILEAKEQEEVVVQKEDEID